MNATWARVVCRGRRSGRTLQWVRALPHEPRALLVHTLAMKHYLVDMLHKERPELVQPPLHALARVYVVTSLFELDRFRGWAGAATLEADHAWLEHATPEMVELYLMLKRLAAGRNRVQ